MSIIKEIGAKFTASDSGFTSALKGMERGIDNLNKKTESVQKTSGRFFDGLQSKAEGASQRFNRIGDSITGLGRPMQNIGGNLTKWITAPIVGATAAATTLVGTLGFKRLIGIDNARAQLTGMGYSAEEVDRIVGQVSEDVTGGMMTVAEGTSVAAGAMAAGVEEGDELSKYIKLVDAASVGMNRSVEETAMIFNRVQGSGKLYTEELNMVEESMPGFSSKLAEHLGVAPEKMREMVTAGEVTSEDFLTVMDGMAGGMAEAFAETGEGMFKNAMANIGIIGEKMFGEVYEQAKVYLAEFLELLRSDEVREWASRVGIVLGEWFTRIVSWVKTAIDWFMNLDSKTQKLIGGFLGFGVAIGPILLALGSLVVFLGSVFSAFGTIFGAVATAIGWFGKFMSVIKTVLVWGSNLLSIIKFLGQIFLSLMTPVGWVVVAIGALAAAFVVAYKKSETFRNFIDGIKDKLVSAWQAMMEFKDKVIGIFQAIFAMFKGDWTGGISILQKLGMSDEQILKIEIAVLKVLKFFHDLKQRVSAILTAIGNFFKTIFDFIKSVVSTAMDFIRNTIIPIMQNIMSVVGSILTGIYNVFKSILNAVWSVVKFIFNGIYSFIKYQINMTKYIIEFTLRLIYTIFKTIFNLIKSVVSTVVTFIVNFVKTRFNIMKANIQIIMNVVRQIISTVWNAIKNVFNIVITAIVNFVRNSFNRLRTIVTTIMTAVRNVISTIWNAIKNRVMAIVNPLINMVRNAFNRLRSALTSIMNTIRNVFSSVWNAIRNRVISIVTPLINRVRNAFNNLRNALTNILNTIRNVFSRIWNSIRDTVTRIASRLSDAVSRTFNRMKDGLTRIMNNLKDAITRVWDNIKDKFTNVADGIKKGVEGTFNKMKDSLQSIIKGISGFVEDMVDGVKKGLNKLVDGVNWVADKIGMDKLPHVSLSTGTVSSSKHSNLVTNGRINRDTFATVGDRGRGNGSGGFRHEMIRYPNGKTILTPDTDTTAYLPKGSMVFNGRQTQSMLPQFSTGTLEDFFGGAGNTGMAGNFEDNKVGNTRDGKGINKLVEGSQGGIFRKIGSAVKSVVGKASDIVGDVFDYIKNPSKLVDKVFDAFGLDFGFLEGSLFSNALTGMISKLKSGISTFFKGGLESAGKGDGSSFTGYRKTTPYSPNAPVPGYPTSFNGGRHYGIDYGTPTGTVLKATNAGTVSRMSDRGGGLVAKLLTGKFTQFFLHLSSILKTGKVKQGEPFAKTGNSGQWTTGPHLHYQVEKGNSPWVTNRNTIDPEKYLSGLKAYARGGIITSPEIAWLAEGGFSESVISHDPKYRVRSKAIYDRTGEMLGFNDAEEREEVIKLLRDEIMLMQEVVKHTKATSQHTKRQADKKETIDIEMFKKKSRRYDNLRTT